MTDIDLLHTENISRFPYLALRVRYEVLIILRFDWEENFLESAKIDTQDRSSSGVKNPDEQAS